MSETTVQSVYFEERGPKNTARTLEIAKRRADELSIHTVLVASTRGRAGVQAAQGEGRGQGGDQLVDQFTDHRPGLLMTATPNSPRVAALMRASVSCRSRLSRSMSSMV